MVATPGGRGGDRYGRAPCEECGPAGQASAVSDEGPSRLEDVIWILPRDESGRMAVPVRIHAEEPGSYHLRRLLLQQELQIW